MTVAAQRAATKSAMTEGISLSRSVRASPASLMIVCRSPFFLCFVYLFVVVVARAGKTSFFCCCIYLFRRLAVLSRIFSFFFFANFSSAASFYSVLGLTRSCFFLFAHFVGFARRF